MERTVRGTQSEGTNFLRISDARPVDRTPSVPLRETQEIYTSRLPQTGPKSDTTRTRLCRWRTRVRGRRSYRQKESRKEDLLPGPLEGIPPRGGHLGTRG